MRVLRNSIDTPQLQAQRSASGAFVCVALVGKCGHERGTIMLMRPVGIPLFLCFILEATLVLGVTTIGQNAQDPRGRLEQWQQISFAFLVASLIGGFVGLIEILININDPLGIGPVMAVLLLSALTAFVGALSKLHTPGRLHAPERMPFCMEIRSEKNS